MPGFDPDKLLIVLGMPRRGTTSLYHSREAVITGIDTVFPRPVIRKVRLAVDKATMSKTRPEEVPLTEEAKQLGERRLGGDREWVNQLFAEHKIQLGDGTPFEPQPASAGSVRRRELGTAPVQRAEAPAQPEA